MDAKVSHPELVSGSKEKCRLFFEILKRVQDDSGGSYSIYIWLGMS